MAQRCPKGHWYDPDVTGEHCPLCATQTQDVSSVTDDDVMAIMDQPEPPVPKAKPPTEEEEKPAVGSAIMRRKKICPECSHEASFSFVYCPRCGAPLKLASVVLRKS